MHKAYGWILLVVVGLVAVVVLAHPGEPLMVRVGLLAVVGLCVCVVYLADLDAQMEEMNEAMRGLNAELARLERDAEAFAGLRFQRAPSPALYLFNEDQDRPRAGPTPLTTRQS